MSRAVFALTVIVIFASFALAQEEFKPGGESTLKWVEPDEGFELMLKETRPGILYFYSAHKAEFCKTIEKDVIPTKSIVRQLKKFVCMKFSTDKEAELLVKYKVEQGEAAVLLLDCQGKVLETIKETPKTSAFTCALRKAEKANKDIKKLYK